MTIKTSTALSSRAIIGRFFMLIEAAVLKAWASKISHFTDTDQSSEEYVLSSMTPAMKRWVGGRDAKRLLSQAITITNEKFETTLVDKRENFQYDKTGQLNQRIQDLVSRAITHWNKLATEALVAGTSTLCYDGQYFFDTDHSFGSSGTLKNLLTSSEVSELNVTTAAAPTAAEFASLALGLINYFQNYLDDQGEPIHEEAKEFLIMVPPNMGAAAMTAKTKALITNGSTLVDNPLIGQDFTLSIQTNPRLTETTKVYCFRTDSSLKPLILQQRGNYRMTSKAEGSDFEHDTDQWEFGVSAERACGLFSWEVAQKATLS